MPASRARVAAAAALAVVVALQIALLARLLDATSIYDEGVYAAAIQALRHGEALGSDVFGAQPPGYYDLLRALSWIFGDSLRGLREATILTVASGTVAAFFVGRRFGGPVAGVVAAAALVIAPPLPLLGARVFADNPAVALALVAFAVVRWPALAGAALAGAISVKLSLATAGPAVAALVWATAPRPRRALLEAAAGAAGLLAVLALLHVHALRPIWDQSVGYHQDATRITNLSGTHELRGFFSVTTPFFWIMLAGAVAFATVARRTWPLWLWPPAAVLFVLVHQPLHVNHLVVLPVSFGLAAGVSLGVAAARLRGRSLAIAAAAGALVFAAGYVQQLHRLDVEAKGEDPALVAAARELERLTKSSDQVVSDQPIVPVLAHRRIPGPLVDTAQLRFDTGSLTAEEVLDVIDERHVAAVVVGRAFAREPRVMAGVKRRFARVEHVEGIAVYHDRRR